jgi:tetratricopeptide (TPR) repeat protein
MKNLLPLLFLLFCLSCQNTIEEETTALTSESEKNLAVPLPEAISLTGQPLFPMKDSPRTKAKKDSLLAIAKMNFENNPKDLDNIIWLGRRTAYRSQHNEAIAIFTKGIEQHPDAPELYRHRGHRYLSQRKFNNAITDFEKAAELAKDQEDRIEPDGLPNKLNIPLSTLKFNIWYHLGLAHYLKGDFAKAEKAYLECLKYSKKPDLLTATSDWLYMTYRRQGKTAEAAKVLESITEDMTIIENDSYYNRLLMYKGLKQPEQLLDFGNITEENLLNLVTQGYGVGNWYLYNNEPAKAKAIFEKVVATDYWSAFGFIAAEADLSRI